MDSSHALDQPSLHLGGADDLITLQEVLSYGHQCLFGPWLEPVYCAAADQARELHGSGAELFSNLQRRKTYFSPPSFHLISLFIMAWLGHESPSLIQFLAKLQRRQTHFFSFSFNILIFSYEFGRAKNLFQCVTKNHHVDSRNYSIDMLLLRQSVSFMCIFKPWLLLFWIQLIIVYLQGRSRGQHGGSVWCVWGRSPSHSLAWVGGGGALASWQESAHSQSHSAHHG